MMQTVKKFRNANHHIVLNHYPRGDREGSGVEDIWEIIIQEVIKASPDLTRFGARVEITYHNEDTARTVYEGIILADYFTS